MPATIAGRSHSQATTAASTTRRPARPADNRTADVYTLADPSTATPRAWPSTSAAASSSSRPRATAASTAASSATPRRRSGLHPRRRGPVGHRPEGRARQALRGRREHGDDQGLRRRRRHAAGDVRHQGRRQLADLRQRPRRHQARRHLRDRLQAPGDLPPDGRGDRRRHAGAQADRPRGRHLDVARDPVQRRAGGVQPQRHRRRRRPRGRPGRHHGDRHRRHGDRRADKLIVVDSDTGQLFRVKVGKDGNAARKIRELAGRRRPVQGRRRPAHRPRPAARRAGLDPETASPTASSTSSTLRRGGRDGRLADQRTDGSFQGPSTIARARDRYLVVNPDFATSTPPFTVTALPR